jgi:VanZ family protein
MLKKNTEVYLMKLLGPKLALVLLILYWIAIFVLTHIPIVHLSFLVTQVNASDKTLHFLAYFLLGFLLWIAIHPFKKVEWRKSRVWWTLFVIVCYGTLDELLQAYMSRSSSIYDFIADISGATFALILLSIFSFMPSLIIVTAMTLFAVKNLTVVNFTVVFPRFSLLFHLFGYIFLSWLWARYIYQSLALKINHSKQMFLFIAGPLTFLLIAEFSAIILGKALQIRDIIISVLSIAIVSLLYTFVLNREN